jgi:pimeloyl-ACP methyl ester carboxylesterase
MRTRLLPVAALVLALSGCASHKTLTVQPPALTAKTFQYSPTVSINYETHGTGATPILLLHGFAGSLETWRDIQPLLEDSFTLYMIDLKGAGLSSKPRDANYTIDAQAQIVESFIAHLDLTNVVLVGHSYGGGVALMTTIRLQRTPPSPLARLILIDGAAYPQKLPFFMKAVNNTLLKAIINQFPAHTRASIALKRTFFDPSKVTDERIDRTARFMDVPGAHYALAQTARQLIPDDMAAFISALPTIQLPTLILWGKNDHVIPLATGQRLQEDIPGAVLEILPNCGHLPHQELPAATAQIIRRFLANGI